jgi:hypoxanthine phosphoribosyltransferase
VTDARPRPAFAHASEAELARILDFYEVRWEYEPHRFPIMFDRSGAVLESFAPDFYLPDLDIYVELTTLKQRLVRKKNRKLRRLRELYPDVRVKLLYARDFRALLLKYGKLALADALVGAGGQATPPRPRAAAGPTRDVIALAEGGMPAADATGAPSKAGLARRSPARRARRTRAEARARAAVRAGPDVSPGASDPEVAE